MEATRKSNHNHRDEATQQSTSSPQANSDISFDNHSLSRKSGKKRNRAPSAEEIGRHGDCGGDVRCQVDFHDGVGEAEGTEGRATQENSAEAVDSSGAQGGMMNTETAVAMEAKDEKRRRLSQETQPVTSIDNSATSQPHEENVSKPRNKKLKSLRLEAIFHPKFENESSEKDIRKEILEKIQNGEGHLEVTLKHSGSLLLWSGGSRFYSKNSANNSVTIVGEFLLRQHMARLWNDNNSNNFDGEIPDINKECKKYDECSNYLQTHRLTLAFEVITPFILGDHGSIPKRSFLILLAVADRKHQTFYTTHELISLAHRFRLPHNDYWIFTSHNGAEKVFEFHDDVREIGTADIVVKGLDQLVDQYHYGGHDIGGRNEADSGRRSNTVPVRVVGNDERERTTRRIVSMHPHLEYQGNILEGLVVRFVPRIRMKKSILVGLCDDGVLGGDNSCYDDDFLTSLNDLALNSKTYLNIASTATFTEEKSPSDGAILSKNVLDFFLRDNGEVTEDESSLRTYLISRYKSQQSQRMELTKGVEAKADWNISSWMQDLKESGELDNETKKIVELIDTLAETNVRVDYKLFREANTYDDDDVAMEICKNTQSQSRRFICMVHIIHDTTFKKYNYAAKKGMMKLFRGFAFQLIFDGDAYPSPAETIDSLQVSPLAASEAADDLDSRPLMLKMKFLPYMVRTFGCRNALKTLSQSGVDAYERYTLGMLQKWGISHGAIKKWQPFFYQWGLYAKDVLDKQRARNQDQKKIAHDNQIPPQNTSSAPVDSISPLRHELSARRYLWHLSAFEKLYRQGTMFSQGTSDSTSACLPNCIFRGLILVVSLTKKISAIFSNVLSVELGIQQRCCDFQRIDEASILSSLQEDGRGGIICNVQLDENKKTLLALIKTNNYNEAIHIVLVGCGQSDIDSRYESETKDHKRISGLAKSWKRLKCKYIHDLPNLPEFMDLDDDGNPSQVRICPQVKKLVDKLTVASNALPSQDTRPGLLVFFPGIPGCGKSSLCGNSNIHEVVTKKCSKIWDSRNNNLTSIETPFKDRQIVVFEGDKIDGKYWPHILKHRLEQSSSITITDKNSTPNAWDIIKEVSEKSKTVPLPILPDATALSTTIVTSQTNAQSCYPFSLQYLAMCMLRVLTRPAGSHNGKLDSETDNACMIVVKFYCLYRGISAEDMGSLILDRTAFNYTEEDCPIVTVPFFKDNCDLELPSDLRDCLMDALRLQNAINTKTSEVNEDDFVSMETRLRELLLLHQDKLKSMSASIDESREKFISQIADRVMDIDDIFQLKNAIEGTGLQQFIEIVSIDVDVKKIHDILFRLATHNVDVGNFLHSRGGLQMAQSSDSDTVQREETADMVLKDGSGTFVEKTHVTMAHFSQLSQQKFRDTYGHLDGNLVSVSVTDLIIGETVAALSVVVPDEIYGETPCVIPAPLNAYPHVTIWFGKGESAARSNDLPSMVERGEAKRVLLKEPVQVSGKIGYWFI